MSLASTPAPSVLAGIKLALKPHAPFAAMSEHDLDRIVRASQIALLRAGRSHPLAGRGPARELLRHPPRHGPRRAPGRDRRRRCVVGALVRRDVPARCAARPARRHQRLPRDAGHVLPRDPGRGVRRPHQRVAGVPGLLHPPPRSPPRPVARQPAGRIRGHRDRAARFRHTPRDASCARRRSPAARRRSSARHCGRWRTGGSARCRSSTATRGRWESSPGRTSSGAWCCRSDR